MIKVISSITPVQEVSVTCVADASDSLDGTYFIISDEVGTVGVWIDTDNSGTTIPAGASAADRAIEVTGVVTDDTAAAVATAVASAINADSKFTASASSGVITINSSTVGLKTAPTAGDSGFTITQTDSGFTTATTSTFHVHDTSLYIVATADAWGTADVDAEVSADGVTWIADTTNLRASANTAATWTIPGGEWIQCRIKVSGTSTATDDLSVWVGNINATPTATLA